MIGSHLGRLAGIPITAAIAVELFHGLVVVNGRIAAAVVNVRIAGDGSPDRPGRSPAGRRTGASGRPARRRRRSRRSRSPSPSRVAGRMPALRPARPAGGPSRAGTGRRARGSGRATTARPPAGPGRMPGRLGWAGGRATDGPAGAIVNAVGVKPGLVVELTCPGIALGVSTGLGALKSGLSITDIGHNIVGASLAARRRR